MIAPMQPWILSDCHDDAVLERFCRGCRLYDTPDCEHPSQCLPWTGQVSCSVVQCTFIAARPKSLLQQVLLPHAHQLAAAVELNC